MTPSVEGEGGLIIANELLEVLDIELTERCNQDCLHCYIRLPLNDRVALSREMDKDLICRTLKEAVSLGCSTLRLTGGEPLLRQDFSEIYDFAYALGLEVIVATNATLITDDIVDLWIKKEPTSLGISIYGWDESSYELTTRTSGSFRRFLDGVRRIQESGLQFFLRYPPLKFLVRNSDKIRALAQELETSFPVPYAWDLPLHIYHDEQASRRLKSLRLSTEEAAQERLKELGVAEEDLSALIDSAGKKWGSRLFCCQAATKRPTINAYGQLQICLLVRHPSTLYNLRTGSLREGLTGFFPPFRKMRIVDQAYLGRCDCCLLRPLCLQCPGASWMEHGNLTTPVDYYCEVAHAEARILGLLHDGEKAWEIESFHDPIAQC